jgi:hypothetical protein
LGVYKHAENGTVYSPSLIISILASFVLLGLSPMAIPVRAALSTTTIAGTDFRIALSPGYTGYTWNIFLTGGTSGTATITYPDKTTSVQTITANQIIDVSISTSYYLSVTSGLQNQLIHRTSIVPLPITLSYSGNDFQFQHTGTLVLIATLSGGNGKVTFYYNKKQILRCVNILSSSQVANCLWKPRAHGFVSITASVIPTLSTFSNSVSAPMY